MIGLRRSGWRRSVDHDRRSLRELGQNQVGTRRRATILWCPDHAVGVTRLNGYAGLFGLWVIPDATEAAVITNGLLPNEDNELFLVIQDRNVATDTDGNLTGASLRKTETSTAEMFGPLHHGGTASSGRPVTCLHDQSGSALCPEGLQ